MPSRWRNEGEYKHVTLKFSMSHKIDRSWDSAYSFSMAEGINVRFSGTLQQFIHDRVEGSGLYSSASEYIRDLVRRDLEREEERRWDGLRAELAHGLAAEESAFVPLNVAALLQKAQAELNGQAD